MSTFSLSPPSYYSCQHLHCIVHVHMTCKQIMGGKFDNLRFTVNLKGNL